MRILIISLAALLTCSVACNKGADAANGQNKLVTQELKAQLDETGFPLPAGTVFTENKDGQGNVLSISFTLPDHCKIIGNTAAGEMVADNGGKLTCACSGSGGCKPFAAGGKMGCIVDGCSKCTGTTSSLSNKELDFFFIQKGELAGMASLAALGDTRAVYSFEEWQILPFPTVEEIATTEFKDALKELLDYAAPFGKDDLVAVAYMVKGKKLLINIPFAALDDGTLYAQAVSGSNYKCSGSCNGGQTKCKLETAGFGQVSYCDGCQSGCTIALAK